MFFLKLILLLIIYCFVRLLSHKDIVLYILVIIGVVQAVVVILQQIGFMESNHLYFPITGFFGNPGQMGGFQAVVLIAALDIFKNCKLKCLRYISLTSVGIILYTLILADSRASFVASCFGVIVIYWTNIKRTLQKKRWVIIPIALVTIIGAMMLYLHRSDSVDARILIWKNL